MCCDRSVLFLVLKYTAFGIVLLLCAAARLLWNVQRMLLAGRESWAGKATCYGLDGPEIEFRYLGGFPHTSWPTVGTTQLRAHWVMYLFPKGKEAGTWRWPRNCIEVLWSKKEQSYTCTPLCGLHGLFYGDLLPFFFLIMRGLECNTA